MKQYIEMKAKHPDAILLFRVGDFYETFSDDAITASEILGITLTRRANGAAQYVELAGFPHHALDTYLPKLVRAGKRVAICEQLEDPKLTKKLVKRGITELVTPGVSINDNILNHRENNFLASIHIDKRSYGIAFLDISTGEYLAAEGSPDYVEKLLNNFAPKEVLYEKAKKKIFEERFGSRYFTYEMDDWIYTEEAATDKLLHHFGTRNLKGFGLHNMHNAITAAGAILYYLDITQHTHIDHITSLARIDEEKYVRLDKSTIHSLELIDTINEGGKSLLDIIDHTISPMGARMLRRWIVFPLKDVAPINERLDGVEYFFRHPEVEEAIRPQLSLIGDMERIISKVAVGRITPREMVQLRVALSATAPIKELCTAADGCSILRQMGELLNPCELICQRIARELNPDAPSLINKGDIINRGVNEELDNLRDIAYSGKDYLLKIQQRESEKTGIPSLKISYNNVFGYYIEVRNTHKDKVPPEWIRKQTLVNAERYITQELKEYEEKILGAEERILSLETRIFNDLVLALGEHIAAIQLNANLIARLDCLLSFVKTARENKYVRPEINESLDISITEGRHPVIEKQLPAGESYVANSLSIGNNSQQIIMITGPNMAGKSALLRQTALIVLMAQIGSFVPADAARIGIVDKIFTRVGASDNISVGESTFMVEMNEAANILNNISERSLILFDELGRGTSTYDGISIAWAIVEHIHEHPKAQAKTLFATHYHELNEMERTYKRIANYNISVREADGKVIFLRKLKEGGVAHCFGIHVARMAGMPRQVIESAEKTLEALEKGGDRKGAMSAVKIRPHNVREGRVESDGSLQLSFFQLDDPVLSSLKEDLEKADLNNMTPLQAFDLLRIMKEKLGIDK